MAGTERFLLRPATLEDADWIAARARRADKDELWACARVTPLEAMQTGMMLGGAKVWEVDGNPLCMFGLNTSVAPPAPWMIASDQLGFRALEFLRGSREVVRGWRDRCPAMANFVDARNREAVRWLGWLGFTIHEPMPYGPDALPFHPFTMGMTPEA